jgi:hypothetical protein
MVDEIVHLSHKPPRAIYGIQMAREELQIIWVRKPTPSAKRPHKSHTSTTNKPPKYSTTNPKSR